MIQTKLAITTTIIFLWLCSCSIHKIDVQQGNVISPESVEKLKTGMTQRQVTSIMGSPLVNDPFHSDRWDYTYRMSLGTENKLQTSHLTLYFIEDKLDRIVIAKPLIAEEDLLKPQLYRKK